MVGWAFSEVIMTNSSSPWVKPFTAALLSNVQLDPARPGVDSHCKATECEPAPRMSFKLPVGGDGCSKRVVRERGKVIGGMVVVGGGL